MTTRSHVEHAVVPGERPRASRLMRHVILDLPSGQVSLEASEGELLRDAAAAKAGSSIAARDLSLLLDRALNEPRPVARRLEAAGEGLSG